MASKIAEINFISNPFDDCENKKPRVFFGAFCLNLAEAAGEGNPKEALNLSAGPAL
jgi:hypothetical protein